MEKKKITINYKLNEFGYIVNKNIKKQFIDYNGKISSLTFEKYNFLTPNGLLLDEWVDDIALKVVEDKYCIFSINVRKKYGIFNKYGDLIALPIYDEITYDKDNIFIAKSQDKYGFITPNGQLTPITFNEVKSFSDTVAAVKYGGKWGYINKYVKMDNPNDDQEYQIKPQYEDVNNFIDGEAIVVLNGEEIKIDRNNNIIKNKVKTKHQ